MYTTDKFAITDNSKKRFLKLFDQIIISASINFYIVNGNKIVLFKENRSAFSKD